MTEIAGRVALVTGGGSGIGRGLALALAAEGASVVVADIAEGRAAEVAAEIGQAGGSAIGVGCDVSDRASIQAMKARAEQAFGTVTLLFANAGVTALQPLAEMSGGDIDWILNVNLHGVADCLHAFLPGMISAGGGHVTATASMAALIPEWLPTHAPYAAAKGGIIAMMLNLRHELSERGVGCTVLCPGGVATRIAECQTVRPDRYGGPSEAGVIPPTSVHMADLYFRPADEVAQMTLRAVRANRPMVLTEGWRREFFMRSYVGAVMQAFDDADAFDRERAPAG
ncbi:SDR family NAD(P)-dependent oxidoreductase [Phenylobacterium sp. LjRoot225]|uniref:SDR family NAD(P)-dependent oxidoreductase n=1 Tax=Phenylobacterium sp. LjRoot225 TaxID=3342285 RepID=UPI003ECF09A2